jgi:predicted dehydrogenase
MIRLAATADAAVLKELATRLTDATLDADGQFAPDRMLDVNHEAVLFLQSGRIESGLIEQCLSAKKHVLLMAQSWLTKDMLESLSAMARCNDVHLAVVNPDRFLPSRQLIGQQLTAGVLGRPGLVRLHRWESQAETGDVKAPDLPTPLLRDLDLATSLYSQSPNIVYAVQGAANDQTKSSDCFLHVHLGFHGGGMALIDYTNRLPVGDDYVSLSVIGSSGAAYADDHQNMQLLYCGGHPKSLRLDERSRQIAALVQEFVDGLNANRDFSTTVAAWLHVLKLAQSVSQSLATGQAIELKAL